MTIVSGEFAKRPAVDDSIDHLNHPARSGIDQKGPLIDNRVAVVGRNVIFPRHPVKDHPAGRKDHSHPRILAVAIR
jgi:hypothetical protein